MKTSTKRIGALIALLGVTASLTACGGGNSNAVEPGTVNTNTEQTSFNIISGISALSGGYDSNEVLNAMAQNAGISITWDTMSDSLSEQVNIRIAGNDLPDGQYTAADDDLNKYRTGYGELAWAMRESAHRILYTVAHSNAMNGYHSGMRVITITPQWIKLLNAATVGVDVAFGVSAAFFVVMLILGNFGTIRAGFSRGKGGAR